MCFDLRLLVQFRLLAQWLLLALMGFIAAWEEKTAGEGVRSHKEAGFVLTAVGNAAVLPRGCE